MRAHTVVGCLVLPLMTEKVLRVVHNIHSYVYTQWHECFRYIPSMDAYNSICFWMVNSPQVWRSMLDLFVIKKCEEKARV